MQTLLAAIARVGIIAEFLVREEIAEIGHLDIVRRTMRENIRITRRLAATARVQYLGIGVGDVDGSFGIYHADLQWRAWKNLAVGIGYTKVTTLVDSADAGFSGRVDFELGGPEAFVRVSF